MNTIRSLSNLFRRAAVAAMAASITLAVVAVPAYGRLHNQIRVTIPFAFSVGKTVLPAGEYTVRDLANGALRVSCKNGAAAIALARIETEGTSSDGVPTLVFNRYGTEVFLMEVKTGWDESCYKLPATAAEQRLARAGTVPREVLMIKVRIR